MARCSRRLGRKLRAVDLFAGCGGLTTGLKQAGFRVVAAVEIDRNAVRTYKKNHPEVHVWQTNIRSVVVRELAARSGLSIGRLDLLAGCPPCQAFSRMRSLNRGRRIRDPRQKDLLHELLRFARVLKPKTIMVENVPGLARDRRWRFFIAALQKLGYTCKSDVLDCADYAVAQRRRRLVLLASRVGVVQFAAPRKRITVSHVLNGLPRAGKSGDPLHDLPEKRTEKVLTRIRSIPKNGGSRSDLGIKRQLECHRRCNGFKDVYGRMRWGGVAPTITSGCFNPSKGRFLHPRENRAITMREAALLQSFPKRYRFDVQGGKCTVAWMIGNALPPQFVRLHAVMLRKLLQSQNRRTPLGCRKRAA